MNIYWNNGNNFWLRTPISDDWTLYAGPGDQTYPMDFDYPHCFIRPASNLNLTNVLFASAAETPSEADNGLRYSTIPLDKAMTLRLDGSSKSIGKVYTNLDNNEIIVTKGSPESTVYLVVQGNEGNQNWYYSKKIVIADDYSVEFVNYQDIKNALATLNITDINLSNCKIWLEITYTDGMIYAVQSKEVDTIEEVKLSIEAPKAGEELANLVYSDLIQWFNVKWDPEDENAAYNTEYTVSIILSPKVEYKFANSVTPKINGIELNPVTKYEDGTITVTYKFAATAKDTIKQIKQPTITVSNGTSIEDIKKSLPINVKIETAGQGELDIPVTWDLNADIFTKYDPNKKRKTSIQDYWSIKYPRINFI